MEQHARPPSTRCLCPHLRNVALLAAVSALWGVVASANPPTRFQRSAVDQNACYYYGLMGEVSQPGVYQTSDPSPRMDGLLQAAGGLTSQASGTLRIIRNGRPGIGTSVYTARANSLMPGDLLVVDAKTNARISHGNPTGSARNRDGSSASLPDIQLAFVNLIADRPIVVKVQGERSSLRQIVADLNQPEGLADQVKVHQTRRTGERDPKPESFLTSETVLVFAPNTVQYERLPAFPQPIRVAQNSINSAIISQPHATSPWPNRNLPSRAPAFAPANQPVKPAIPTAPRMIAVSPNQTLARTDKTSVAKDWKDNTQTLQSTPGEKPSIFPEETKNPHNDSQGVTSGPPTRQKNPTPEPPGFSMDSGPETLSERQAPSAPEITESEAPRQMERVAERGGIESVPPFSDDAPVAIADTRTVAPPNPQQSREAEWPWSTVAVLVIGGSALLAALALLWSMARDAVPSTAEGRRDPSSVLLKKLLGGQLAFVEEPLVLPIRTEFHGRPQPSREFSVDIAHGLRGPVIPPAAYQAAQESAAGTGAISSRAVGDAGGIAQDLRRTIRRDRGHTGRKAASTSTTKSKTEAVKEHAVDRALLSVQGGVQS